MKKAITFISFVYCVTNLFAQNTVNKDISFPATYVITTDTISHNTYLPDSCWEMVADPSGKLTFEQVTQHDIFKDTIRKINFKNKIFWLRYRIANKMQKEAKITLRVNTQKYFTARSDLYLKTDSSQWEHLKTGHGVPWSERDGLKRFYYINVIIPAGKEITVYQKDKMDYFLYAPFIANTNVSFGFTETIIKNDYVYDDAHYIPAVESSFLLGLFALALVINLYFFIIVREKEFLYFTLFLLSTALGYQSLTPLDDVIFRESPQLQSYLIFLSGIFLFFTLIFFIRHFLKTFVRFPRWDRWLVILAFAQVLFGLFNKLSFLFVAQRTILMLFGTLSAMAFISISLLVTILLYIRSHDKIVRLLIFAVSPFICIWVFITLSSIVLETLLFGFHVNPPAFLVPILQMNGLFLNISYVWMVLVFSWVLFLRFSSLRKKIAMQEVEKERERNALIAQQKIELEKQVAKRTSELKQSFENLKSTQKQLIQSEKMASLGELTAGIAHEIQNPLNFVNNFSDINKEMIEELRMRNYELKIEDPEIKELLNDIEQNSEKINHHGKRADAIVKGMLQHSRISSGKKEPTDINALCDEYLRLSYHGMRAKDKNFNCEMKTDFDKSIGKINIVPQDIVRVILNLINNAFYACAERSRSTLNENEKLSANSYQPIAEIKTRKVNDTIEIRVMDNGNGIPEKIKDKIFQPFFTTKPTGQGTGLGLSLSYDIVKAHGGEIKVESKEGVGTEFIILLQSHNS